MWDCGIFLARGLLGCTSLGSSLGATPVLSQPRLLAGACAGRAVVLALLRCP